MDFDESEWVLADASEVTTGIAGDWVLADGPEGSISGVFFRRRLGDRCAPSYAAFGRGSHPAESSLSFLPPSVSVNSSSRGLLLLRGPWSSYYVCNPATSECRRIPRPLRPHHPSSASPAALSLVSRPDKPSCFHLVCAFEVPGDGGYRFETFSSETGQWWESATRASSGRIVPGSGVSAGGAAYWRTESPGGIIAYDPEADEARAVPPPPGCEAAGDRWQLGEVGGGGGGGDEGLGRLCCACVTGSMVVAHGLGPSDQWSVLGSFGVVVAAGDGDGELAAASWGVADDPIVCRELPWPLRFESAYLEVVLWVDGRLVAVDLESRWMREVRFADGPAPAAPDGEYVAHINTLVPVGST